MANAVYDLIRIKAPTPVFRKVLLIAGEESGDIYAGRIISHLMKISPGLRVEGIGGERMRKSGGHTFYDISEMSTVGFISVIGRIPFYRRVLKDLKARIASGEYDSIILIDYPDFNLRVAKMAEKSGVPVFYYVCPQFWAWRRYRVRAVRKLVDMMIVVFSFEEDFYLKHGVNARFLGHPILDETKLPEEKERVELRKKLGAGPGDTLLGLLPGSRNSEVETMAPLMLESLKTIRAINPVKVVIPCADSIDSTLLEKIVADSGEEALIVKGKTWETMCASDFLICKSGTSTLQAAIAGTPMVIVYKQDAFSYHIAKYLAYVQWVGLPNLLLDREVVPELLQNDVTPMKIATACTPYLSDPEKYREMKEDLLSVRSMLGEPGAAKRAAELIVNYMRKIWVED